MPVLFQTIATTFLVWSCLFEVSAINSSSSVGSAIPWGLICNGWNSCPTFVMEYGCVPAVFFCFFFFFSVISSFTQLRQYTFAHSWWISVVLQIQFVTRAFPWCKSSIGLCLSCSYVVFFSYAIFYSNPRMIPLNCILWNLSSCL